MGVSSFLALLVCLFVWGEVSFIPFLLFLLYFFFFFFVCSLAFNRRKKEIEWHGERVCMFFRL